MGQTKRWRNSVRELLEDFDHDNSDEIGRSLELLLEGATTGKFTLDSPDGTERILPIEDPRDMLEIIDRLHNRVLGRPKDGIGGGGSSVSVNVDVTAVVAKYDAAFREFANQAASARSDAPRGP